MTTLNKDQIINLLPHREPMLLIDRLINIVHLKSATAVVQVKKKSFFVQINTGKEITKNGINPEDTKSLLRV